MFGTMSFGFVVNHTEEAVKWGAKFLRELGCKVIDLREGDIEDATNKKVDEYYAIIAQAPRRLFERIKDQNNMTEHIDLETNLKFLY